MTTQPPKLLGIILLAAAAALPLSAAATIYKWTDANGHVHYSQNPPPGGRKAEVIKPPPSPADTAGAVQDLKAKEKKLQQLRKDREKAKQESSAAQKKAAAKKSRCDEAKHRLERLTTTTRVYKTDAQGNRVRVPEPERQADIEKARKDVAKFCD